MKPGMKHGGGKISYDGNEFAALEQAHEGGFPKDVVGFGSCILQIHSDLIAINADDPCAAISSVLDSDVDSDERRQTLARIDDVLKLCIRAFKGHDGDFFRRLAALTNSPYPDERSVNPELAKFVNMIVMTGAPKTLQETREALGINTSDRTLSDWYKRYGMEPKKKRPGRRRE